MCGRKLRRDAARYRPAQKKHFFVLVVCRTVCVFPCALHDWLTLLGLRGAFFTDGLCAVSLVSECLKMRCQFARSPIFEARHRPQEGQLMWQATIREREVRTFEIVVFACAYGCTLQIDVEFVAASYSATPSEIGLL